MQNFKIVGVDDIIGYGLIFPFVGCLGFFGFGSAAAGLWYVILLFFVLCYLLILENRYLCLLTLEAVGIIYMGISGIDKYEDIFKSVQNSSCAFWHWKTFDT